MLKYIVRDMYGAMRFLPIAVLSGALAYLLLRIWNERRVKAGKSPWKLAAATGYCVCLAVIVSMTLLSRERGDGEGIDLRLLSTWGINRRNNAYAVENILLFMPYGFFGAWNFRRLRNFFWSALAGLGTSVVIESLQFVTRTGFFQIDDILTNFLGAVLGWALFGICAGLGRLFKP